MIDRDSSPQERLQVTVHGRVQGVGFRVFVARAAHDLDISGWVANRDDGSVQLVAEGDRGALDAFQALVRKGPPGASVLRLEARRVRARGGLSGFEVRHGSHPGD